MFVRAKVAEKRRARELRAEGWSVKAIAREVGVSVSSVSVWVRDLPRGTLRTKPVRSCRLPVYSGQIKHCGACRRDLPIEAFNRDGTSGRQDWCRECFKAYFRKRGTKHLGQVRKSVQRRRLRARTYVLGVLQRSRCVDCGDHRLVVLDFDHVRGVKAAVISRLVYAGASIDKIQREIDKCEVVCANCHRRRTGLRQGSWRAILSLDPAAKIEGATSGRIYIRSILEAGCCVDCGETDILILEFDHVGPKRFSISIGLARGYGVDRLAAEVAGCEIRCASCHRLKTAEREGQFRHHAVRPRSSTA